jgi:hypothetical protein
VRVRYLGWEAGRLRHAAYRGVASPTMFSKANLEGTQRC